MSKAVFLDRDGTLSEHVHYLSDPEKFRLMPDAIKALKLLAGAGYKLVVVTNQSGVARGLFTEETLARIHGRMKMLLADGGVRLDGVYYCPHHPEAGCSCRKPATGMIDAACAELGIECEGSFMVGDATADILLGENAGLKTILVATGYGGKEKDVAIRPDYVASDLYEAALIILGRR
jgi:histidinol-phosphate phosphatase family protein